ncbi:hypothetical protein GCM10011611_60370 [Aliidongia dinghuensis]|uniref:DUF2019 domain-containing protein n=1 Tax=Aliidongia dinghuensis TaxID=1867774 RepID=A0A8J2Z1M4_9PROT|nr:DUF2019 domain-containing protein [Aliidongia dinghuensis]GGF45852.1 hypothetical protein GCM10011611_60370 [Aliidongia dinghuensis]
MKLDTLTVDELISLFVSFSEQQYPLTLNDEGGKAKQIIKKRNEIDKELRRRGIAARLELTKLFTHPNTQVRINAATTSLGVAREPALGVLRQIIKEDFGPFRLDARMTIALIEDGTVNPT